MPPLLPKNWKKILQQYSPSMTLLNNIRKNLMRTFWPNTRRSVRLMIRKTNSNLLIIEVYGHQQDAAPDFRVIGQLYYYIRKQI